MENLARPSSDGAVDDSADAIAKIESRWRNAVKKASKRVADPEVLVAFDTQRAQEIAQRAATVEPPAWSPVRAAQLRKVEPSLAEQQHDWLVPTVQGEFAFDESTVSWQFVLPQPIAHPVAMRLGDQPMQPDADGDTISASSPGEQPGESCELVVSAGSFLLNWITVPWSSLTAEAKHALVHVGVQPFVDSLGHVMNAHWQISGLVGGAPVGAPPLQTAGTPITIGVAFRRDGVAYADLASLQIPHEIYRKFLAHREATRPPFSIARLIAERPSVADLAITLPVVVGEFSSDLGTVQALTHGDVVFFAEHRGSAADWWHSSVARIATPSARIDVQFDVSRSAVVVRAVVARNVRAQHGTRECAHYHSLFRERESIMQAKENPDGAVAASAGAGAGAGVSGHLAEVPVTLTVEVAELQLPLHALEELTVGNTLPLQKPLNEQLLTLRANGQVIAMGEMVMLEGEVGVRIRRLASHAAPAAAGAARTESAPPEEPAESVAV
jgi:type III secretion system YscQ/HrcQ family protein